MKILTQKWLEQKIIDNLCNQNVLFAELKSQNLWKNKKQSVFLSNLGIRIPLSKIPLLYVLF